jgi:hypothetical protein
MMTISNLKKSFDKWRREHGGKLTGLPPELQSQAVLLGKHSWKEVSKQLHVSTATLNRWRKSLGEITPRAPDVIDAPPHRHRQPRCTSHSTRL